MLKLIQSYVIEPNKPFLFPLQLISLAKYSGAVEIEQNFLGRRFIALTAYYGDLVNY